MNLTSIGKVENSCPNEDYYMSDYWEFEDGISALMEEADVALVTLTEPDPYLHKEKIWVARLNFKGGQCGCCGTFSFSKVKTFEGFKVQ